MPTYLDLQDDHRERIVNWLAQSESVNSILRRIDLENEYDIGLSPWPSWLTRDMLYSLRDHSLAAIGNLSADRVGGHLINGLVKPELLASKMADNVLDVGRLADALLEKMERLVLGGALDFNPQMLRMNDDPPPGDFIEAQVVGMDDVHYTEDAPRTFNDPTPKMAEQRAMGLDPLKVYVAGELLERLMQITKVYGVVARDRNTLLRYLSGYDATSKSFADRAKKAEQIMSKILEHRGSVESESEAS